MRRTENMTAHSTKIRHMIKTDIDCNSEFNKQIPHILSEPR